MYLRQRTRWDIRCTLIIQIRISQYIYAGYRIFVAEVAPTCNEALLMEYLLKNTEDTKEKMYLIDSLLGAVQRNTVPSQTMFAEFEKITHEMAVKKEPLYGRSIM